MALEQISTFKGFKGICYAYDDCNKEWGTIEEVDQKRPQEYAWPKTIPKKKQGCQSETRGKPDERGKSADGIQGQAESCGAEVDGKKGQYFYHIQGISLFSMGFIP